MNTYKFAIELSCSVVAENRDKARKLVGELLKKGPTLDLENLKVLSEKKVELIRDREISTIDGFAVCRGKYLGFN